jgi:antitoxin HigA-1
MARTAIHPGEHLADELKALGMSAAALSRDINVPVNRITGIINGTRAITADTAIRLGHWFGTSAEFWLNLQKLYELRRACRRRRRCGKAALARGDLAREEHAPRRGCASARSTAHHRGLNQENARNRLSGQDNRHESSTEPSSQASQAGNSKGTMSMGDVVIVHEEVAPKRQVGEQRPRCWA